MRLYITYTSTDLNEHGAEACSKAIELGFDVIDAGRMLNSLDRSNEFKDCDAVLLLLARVYGENARDSQISLEESEWDSARTRGIPIGVLQIDRAAKWPLDKIQFDTEKINSLEKFRQKVTETQYKGFFDQEPCSVHESLEKMLPELRRETEKRKQISIFVVWDFTIKGLNLILSSLQKRPPEGFQIVIPGLESGGSSGEIFRDIVLPGIQQSDRVLVVTDRPNANVAFEAGLAVGFGKPISLIHFGAKIPEWLNVSAFRGFIIKSIQDLNQLREVIRNEDNWFKQQLAPKPIPNHGSTLFLCPSCYVGSALREEQKNRYPYWNVIPESGYNLKDLNALFSNVAQVIWCITTYREGTDSRDGSENAANGIMSGWFYARILQETEDEIDKRLRIIRQQNDRDVVDVKVIEEIPFIEIEDFSNRLEAIGKHDYRLPFPEARDKEEMGLIKYEMVSVPPLDAGKYKALWVGIHPVTNRQYKQFCEDTSYPAPEYLISNMYDPNKPVVSVSINDAEKFCKWAGLELPTRTEWEHFTKANSGQKYWWGDDDSLLSTVAWYQDNSGDFLHRVGEKKPNTWGIYDLLGNVWEWTEKYSRYVTNPFSDEKHAVWKTDSCGGAYNSFSSQLTNAVQHEADKLEPTIGFRCVKRVANL